MIEKRLILFALLVLFSCCCASALVFDTQEISVDVSEINQSNSNSHYTVDNWYLLPHKDQRLRNQSWVDNSIKPKEPIFLEDWRTTISFYDVTSMKCLSYAVSTINDWVSSQSGRAMPTYQNIINGETNTGTNFRELEQIYFSRHQNNYANRYYYPISGINAPLREDAKLSFLDNLVLNKLGVCDYCELVDYGTGEHIPYNIEGYATILTNPPFNWKEVKDDGFNYPGNFKYTVFEDEYLSDWKYTSIPQNKNSIEEGIKKFGPLYAQVMNEFGDKLLPVHAVPLIGYGEKENNKYDSNEVFWIHESYTDESGKNSKYKAIGLESNDYPDDKLIYKVLAFYDPQWPTFQHDNRRTGFTLLKGDLKQNDIEKLQSVLQTNNPEEEIDHSSIADLDNNGIMDIVVTTSRQNPLNGTVYAVEWNGSTLNKKWEKSIGSPIPKPPTIVDIDNDNIKEVIFGTYYGVVYVLNGKTGNIYCNTCTYPLYPKYDSGSGVEVTGHTGLISAVDLDLDSKKEIIFTEYHQSDGADWPAELYVLDNRLLLRDKITVGNDGAISALAIADTDNDNLMEIFVPTYLGMKAYEYSNRDLRTDDTFTDNNDKAIWGAPVIYDIDRDGEYEIIYVTTEYPCPTSGCDNQLYIKNKNGNNNRNPIDLSNYRSQVTPTIADILGDSNPEIILLAYISTDTNYYALCYDGVNGSACPSPWPYGAYNGIPREASIADVTGDGNYNIIFGSKDNKTYILNHTGQITFAPIDMGGKLGSSPAIGDVDDDKTAEIVIKHKGSPTDYISALGSYNKPPVLNSISNITGKKEGDLIFINQSGEITATDPNNDSLTFYYGYPFNESGYWQTKCEDSGNHTVLIEVSDGSLTDSQFINVEVAAECPRFGYNGPFVGIIGNVTIEITAYEPESESITYYISDNRFTKNNNIFTWNPSESDIGTFPVNISISDGTINNTQEFNVTVVNATKQTIAFSDGSSTKLLTYTQADNQTVYIKLKKDSEIIYADLRIEGLEP